LRSLWTQFSLNAIPASFLVDRDGNLVKVGLRGPQVAETVGQLLNN
jgi:hypothetical protein